MISFVKMQANGNDFMIIDAWHQAIEAPEAAVVKQWADRHTGVGFDQLLYFTQSDQPNISVHCRVFNADGSESGQCGHGMACIAQWVYQKGYLQTAHFSLGTIAGIWKAVIVDEQTVSIDLGCPILTPQVIPFIVDTSSLLYPIVFHSLDKQRHQAIKNLQSQQYTLLQPFLESIKNRYDHDQPHVFVSVLSLGNPHCVVPVVELDTMPVHLLGKMLSEHAQFPHQANVEFMQIMQSDRVHLRVYERGVGENQACGSGACAAVIAGCLLGYLSDTVTVQFPQGDAVQVIWPDLKGSVKLKTTVQYVFKGQI